jgi:phosphoglycolate phosphatase-like HAD superfamily hydrolase
MQTKVLLFDFDGTIADTMDWGVRTYNEIAIENNYKLITKENITDLRNKSARDNVRDFGIPLLKLPFIARRVRAAFKSEIPNLKVIEGMAESLKLLKNKGYKIYVVSSNSKENIQSFLDLNRIKDFDGIHSVSRLFGKHNKIKSLIKANRWDLSSVMYIGDEVRDIDAARKARIKCVAVAWGYNTEEVLVKNNPHMILRDPSELNYL